MGFTAHPSPLSLELSKFTSAPTAEQLNRYKAIQIQSDKLGDANFDTAVISLGMMTHPNR